MQKTVLIMALCVMSITCVAIEDKSNQKQLEYQSQITDLQQTGWGRIGVSLLEMQLQTEGTVSELIMAFQNLISDLRFKVDATQQRYQWDRAEHIQLDLQINERVRDARVRYGVAREHLQNTFYPERTRLEDAITYDNGIITDTEAQMVSDTEDRDHDRGLFEKQDAAFNNALAGIRECVELVQGLQEGSSSLLQVKKAQDNLKEISKKLNGMGVEQHMATALLSIAQAFANHQDTQAVLNLLDELRNNLLQSQEDCLVGENASIAAFEAVMEVAEQTVFDANARVDENQASLDVCNSTIEFQEGERDTAEADRDQAAEELEIETARWDAYEASYLDLMDELNAELDSLDRIIQLFGTVDISDQLFDRMDNHGG